jgi:hypothetical protein
MNLSEDTIIDIYQYLDLDDIYYIKQSNKYLNKVSKKCKFDREIKIMFHEEETIENKIKKLNFIKNNPNF